MLRPVSAFHLFTIRGIPVFISPMYLLLLVMFGYRDPMSGVLWAVCITIALLVHELGHAFVARHLKHEPSILLHGLGGLTSRTRTGRDVEEATIIAMGPAAGLALGLIVYGVWEVLLELHLATPLGAALVQRLLVPCITWNLLNLLPLWPLDGGQLFRIGAGRWLGAQRARKITHVLALVMVVGLGLLTYRAGMNFTLVLLAWLGFQNFQALQGNAKTEEAPVASSHTAELVDAAGEALRGQQYKEAARLAHQARALDGLSPPLLERIWEVLGLATWQLGDYEEALGYLRRARPTERVREATLASLTALGRDEELDEYRSRWAVTTRSAHMQRWLVGALGFIVVAISMVFTTSLADFFF
jgi:stage IV sporulation protein FB